MGTYEEDRLVREIFAVQMELQKANEQSRSSGQVSELSFSAIRSDLDRIDDNLLGIRDSLQQIAYSVDSQLSLIASHLASSGELLERIMNSVQNPVATRAHEFCRHGLLAFKNGWLSEAVTEFRKSIDVYGYDPIVHFALGWALAREQSYQEAAESFAKATRYGYPDHHSLAASAAILSANLFDKIGSSERAVAVLTACHEAIPAAADVAYELARRTGQRQHLSAALSLKPTLLVRARVDNLVELEHAAHDVLHVLPGFAGLQADTVRASEELATLLEQEGRPSPERVVPLPPFPAASARLALFTGELPLTRQRLSTAINEVRAYVTKLSETARNRLQDASSAKAGLAKPVPPPESKLAQNRAIRTAIWGVIVLVMLILTVNFETSGLAGTSSGKAVLTGLSVWGGLLISAGFFLASIGPAVGAARKNADVRARYRASVDDYRKRLAAYEADSSKAVELQTIADEASRKVESFAARADSVVAAAEEARRRLDWRVVEPLI